MRKILPRKISNDELYVESFSVVSECVFYLHSKAIVNTLFPNRDFTFENLDRIVNHSVDRTCNWIMHLAEIKKDGKRKRWRKRI